MGRMGYSTIARILNEIREISSFSSSSTCLKSTYTFKKCHIVMKWEGEMRTKVFFSITQITPVLKPWSNSVRERLQALGWFSKRTGTSVTTVCAVQIPKYGQIGTESRLFRAPTVIIWHSRPVANQPNYLNKGNPLTICLNLGHWHGIRRLLRVIYGIFWTEICHFIARNWSISQLLAGCPFVCNDYLLVDNSLQQETYNYQILRLSNSP